MKIGFGAPVSGSWATPANQVRIARRAEELGYHSLWTFQRLLSLPGDPVYHTVVDPVATLGFLAGQTSRIRLGVAVINMPFLPVALLAKQLSTLDVLSTGRLDAGVGNGWNEQEFAAVGATRSGLGRRADAYLQRLVELFEGEEMLPRPVQRPHPPILLGGSAPTALRRAGRLADGWVSASRTPVDEVGNMIHTVKLAAAEAGRDPSALRFVIRKPVNDAVRADLAAYAEAGATEVFLDLNFVPTVGAPDVDPERSMDMAERVLEEFAPAAG